MTPACPGLPGSGPPAARGLTCIKGGWRPGCHKPCGPPTTECPDAARLPDTHAGGCRRPRFLRRHRLRRDRRPLPACRRGTLYAWPVAGGAGRRLYGLGRPPGQLTRQADDPGRQGGAQMAAPGQLDRPLRWRGRQRALHRAAAAGPALPRSRLEHLAVQPVFASVPAAAAMVAQCHHRRARRGARA